MKIAETVTFGGSGLDRAAHIRGDAAALEAAKCDAGAQSLVLWRGKPLLRGDGRAQLVKLQMGHALFGETKVPPIFLGLEEENTPIFAHDVSGWEPEALNREEMGVFVDQTEQQHPLGPRGRCILRVAWRDGAAGCARCRAGCDGKGDVQLASLAPVLCQMRHP